MRDIELELTNRIAELTNSMQAIEKLIEKGGSIGDVSRRVFTHGDTKNALGIMSDRLKIVIATKNAPVHDEIYNCNNRLLGFFINTGRLIEIMIDNRVLKLVPMAVNDDGTITLKINKIQ